MRYVKTDFEFPSGPGVYMFYRYNSPLYIGKAAHLKKRLGSYFRKNAGEKASRLIKEATKLAWVKTDSEIEAFLKEAELIKKYSPKYNYLWRDDKNYFFVEIGQEKFPRVFITHRPYQKSKIKNNYIGPFTSGKALKLVLKLLRHIFPYCTCRKFHKRPCLNAQIGRCSGYCCIQEKSATYPRSRIRGTFFDYRNNIRNIVAVLGGKKKRLLGVLKKKMFEVAGHQEFERAAKIRDEIKGLENVFLHQKFLKVPTYFRDGFWPKVEKYIRQILGVRQKISRVEGYDISNIFGTEATGSMVVFLDGLPAKSAYRKFKIKTVEGISDTAMLKEVIRRRLAHREWQYPDLMLIDGGKAQLDAALSVINDQLSMIKVAALAKREEELYVENRKRTILLGTVPSEVRHFFQRVRDEAHRFAKKYHHKLREISYRG